MAGTQMRAILVTALLLATAFAGCTAAGASGGNFELKPDRIGWYIDERAHFTLNITPSLTKQAPAYTIDRDFAIEEIRYEERGATFGGDYKTRDSDTLNLVLHQNGTAGEMFTLTAQDAGIDIYIDIPDKLRDSEYVLQMKLFKVGWVKSEPFRIDEKTAR